MSKVAAKQTRVGFRAQEAGLLAVISALAVLLAIFGGTVRLPKMETLPDGSRTRVFLVDADGNKTPQFEEKNKFLNAQSLTQLGKDSSFIGIMAVGMTFVIIAGQIDLSVGATYALVSVLGALFLKRFGPDGAGVAMGNIGALGGAFLCVVIGLACGLANGFLITALQVHPFIVTLGTMAVFRGIAFVVTAGQSVGGFPAALRTAVQWEIGGLTLVPLAATLLVVVVGSIVLTRMALGRQVYAVGGNEVASRYSGIRIGWIKVGVFAVSGLCAGLAALLSLGYYGAATSGDGQGYELSVIAASVVGGASLSGGRGSALGALLGALIIQMINSGIVILGIDQNYSQIIVGLVVIAAVLLDQAQAWWVRRRTLASL
jgi:ribose transport system permease protein